LLVGPRLALLFRRRLGTPAALGWLALGALLLVLLGTAAARTAATRKAFATSAVYTVKATAYEAVLSQTDSKPFVTADNSRIPRGYGSHTRWLALSRDLLRPWGGPFEFGDKVRVRGMSPALDGVYTVHDTMNRRYRHCLDVLVHPREHVSISQTGVKIQRISSSKRRSNTNLLLTTVRTSSKQKVAHTIARRSHRAKRLAAAPRLAKQAARLKHNAPLTRQKHRVVKQPLVTLPRHAKKRLVA
jgi:hypothetical protein